MEKVYVLQIVSDFDGILETSRLEVYASYDKAKSAMDELVKEDLEELNSHYGTEHVHIYTSEGEMDEVEDGDAVVYSSENLYESYEMGYTVGTTLNMSISEKIIK